MQNSDSNTTYQKKLTLLIFLISLILTFRLAWAAMAYDNWPGFWYSTLHVVIVAVAVYRIVK